jgi:hypothetical protein
LDCPYRTYATEAARSHHLFHTANGASELEVVDDREDPFSFSREGHGLLCFDDGHGHGLLNQDMLIGVEVASCEGVVGVWWGTKSYRVDSIEP